MNQCRYCNKEIGILENCNCENTETYKKSWKIPHSRKNKPKANKWKCIKEKILKLISKGDKYTKYEIKYILEKKLKRNIKIFILTQILILLINEKKMQMEEGKYYLI